MQRRAFLAGAAGAALTGIAAEVLGEQSASPAASPAAASIATIPLAQSAGERKGEMLYRELGKTGERVSAIGLGGYHLSQSGVSEQQTMRLLRGGIDRGITFLDNSWDYNGGVSEERMGTGLQGGYRAKVFLMTKVDGRTKAAAARQIEESLRRLKTDHIDLLQHHEVIRMDDPDRIFAEGGAMEAFLDAKKAGKIRYIGFTGHKSPEIHLAMLKVAAAHGFHFDAAQMPLNPLDAHYRSFAQLVVPELVKQGIGVLGMKPFCGGNGIILQTNTVQALECLHYALSLPTSVVITGIANDQTLEQAFAATKDFKPYSREQMTALLGKTREVAMTGHYELFKTTAAFDATSSHPEYLGGNAPGTVQGLPYSG